jgi:hypothetical protein
VLQLDRGGPHGTDERIEHYCEDETLPGTQRSKVLSQSDESDEDEERRPHPDQGYQG